MAPAPDYATPGPLTDLTRVDGAALAGVPAGPVEICRLVPGLVIHPLATEGLGLRGERFDENQLRPAASIVRAALRADARPVHQPREAASRVVGTCRHFAVLACALLRYRGIPSRARCGFGSYFQPGLSLDHWITEYWDSADGRWVRVDVQHLPESFVARPQDLRPAEFLTGGEAWLACRAGAADPATFGVYGTENFGPAEVRGNVIRDLAALNKTEMLPWDEWGRMGASYRGETGADYDALMDAVAQECAAAGEAGPDGAAADGAAADAYARADLAVPPELIG